MNKSGQTLLCIQGETLAVSYELLADHIVIVKSAFSEAANLIELSELVGVWRNDVAEPGLSHSYRSKTNKAVSVSASTDRRFAAHELSLRSVIHEAARFYSSMYPHASWSKDDGLQLLRYEPGQSFGLHVDAANNRKMMHRQLSALVYLNDDYEGGEIHFPVQGVKLKPESGSVLLFPPFWTHPHEALPPSKGTKYVVTSWLRAWKGPGFRSE